MSRLQGPDSDLSGQDKSSSVTDLPFVDLIITHSAMMLRVMPSTSSSVIAPISDHDPELTQQEGEMKNNLDWAILALCKVMSHFMYLQIHA